MISCSHWGLYPCPVWVTAEWDEHRYDYAACRDWYSEFVPVVAWPKPTVKPYAPPTNLRAQRSWLGWPDDYNSDNVNG